MRLIARLQIFMRVLRRSKRPLENIRRSRRRPPRRFG